VREPPPNCCIRWRRHHLIGDPVRFLLVYVSWSVNRQVCLCLHGHFSLPLPIGALVGIPREKWLCIFYVLVLVISGTDGQFSLKTNDLIFRCKLLGLNQLRHAPVTQHPL
jgi:hypothetical protein